MEILISHKSSVPIYEQICSQIKEMVLAGELKPKDMITSVRALAKELGIAILTVQKSYDKLQQEGYIETVVGKGTYITDKNAGRFEDQRNQIIENKVVELIEMAHKYDVGMTDLTDLIKFLFND